MVKPKEKPERFDQIEMDLEHCAASFKMIAIHLNSIASFLESYESKSKPQDKKINSIVKALEGSLNTIDKIRVDAMLPQNAPSQCYIAIMQFQHRLKLVSEYIATPNKDPKQLSKVSKALDNINRSLEGLEIPRSN